MIPVVHARVELDDLTAASELSGWDVGLAIASLVVAWIVGRAARSAVLKLFRRLRGVSEDLRQAAARLAKYFVWLIGFGVALSFLGAAVQPLLSAVIIVAVVVVLSLRGIADNFAAGIVIQTRRPVQLGDEVESLGHVGTVTELNGRAVVIETRDGQVVHLPNRRMLDEPIVNNSAHAARRTEIEIRAARGDDIEATLTAIEREVSTASGLDRAREPTVLLRSAEPKRIAILVRIWHDPRAQAAVTSAVVRDLATAMERLGIDATVVTPPPSAPSAPAPPI